MATIGVCVFCAANELLIEKLESDTEYSIKINAGYAKGSKYTGYGEVVTLKTLIDESTRLSLANNADGQSIDVTVLNAIPGETYYIYRSTESGNKLVGITDTAFCTVKAEVGDNTLYAKAESTGMNTAKAKIRLYKADVKLVLSGRAYIGCAHLTVSSIVDVKNIWYYRVNADGSSKLVKASSSIYYTADAFKGANQYFAKAEVEYPDGTTGVISSNTVTVDIETPAMILTCTQEGTKVKIDVQSDFEITDYWIYRINADGKSTLLVDTQKSTTYLPASWGTTFKVKVCIILRGNEMYLGSDSVSLS